MADVIRKAVNKFTKGLVMDFSPENTSNELLTHALNATLLTFNGNELSLQNDMGNARVETAFLPEGYIPVGTCEYGGIIYIVSYNPIEDKSQIGCFPSPERTVSNEELGEFDVSISKDDFQSDDNGNLKNTTQCVLLKKDSLNPGDKFVVTANESIYGEALQDLVCGSSPVEHPKIALNVVSIEDSGRIVYLNSDIRDYTKGNYTYHILGSKNKFGNSKEDLDAYRTKASSGYSVFKSKTSGKLAILAELVMIDSYSVTHSVVKTDEEEDGVFDVIIHTEVEPTVDESNYNVVPKLKYYYLKHSQGYLQRFNTSGEEYKATLFPKSGPNGIIGTVLGDIYETTTGEDLKLSEVVLGEENFDFPVADTYYKSNKPFIPDGSNGYTYPDIKLATFKVPSVISEKSLPDLPFKYDYTIVPCMSYGKLDHLAVSNTVDFSKLHDFNKSNFNTWKYRIDGDQLRLTFGAEVFDTLETDKVSGLVLEFYDLWGFAGSIEISNKKSYSGVYTKIIPLNALGAISKNKIESESIVTDYTHNINIIPKDDGYYYNNEKVSHTEKGWKYENDDAIDNDCGTLYSNLVYGVKTYFKVTDGSGKHTYIPKKELFLFTIPIYNDLYYTISDFSTLEYPKLDMLLTYKIEDESSTGPFDAVGLVNGYNESDYATIAAYKEGNYQGQQFSVTKHVSYKGTSKLYLEVGLKPEYNSLNIFHDPDINKYFSCTLQLIGNNSDENYLEVKSENSSISSDELLGYAHNFEKEVNTIQFTTEAVTKANAESTITFNDGIRNFNFINPLLTYPEYISLKYEFVVGYKISVEDIKNTPIPATTFCALYHKNDVGMYNAEDFGVYVQKDESDNDVHYSNAIFYNSGTADESIFGIGKQVAHTGNLEEQVQLVDYIKTATEPITTLGQFNAGEPLKYLTPYIGKLTFCQPHVHGLGDSNSTTLQKSGNSFYFGQKPDPTKQYKKSALYNISLNTKSAINYNTEFISSIEHDTIEIENSVKRVYTGITGDKLENFNKCLLTTMASVYAYNPDYNTLNVKVGQPNVIDNKVQFVSNIISKDASFKFSSGETLNDYVYIGSIKFSDYLNKLTTYSNIITKSNNTVVPQLQFQPDCTYCGESPNAYLLSPLTYKTEAPQDIISDLTFSKSDLTVVRHSDGSLKVITGTPDKKTLYGWGDSGVLVKLDVSNYTIDANGKLTVSFGSNIATETMWHTHTLTQEDYNTMKSQATDNTLPIRTITADLIGKRIENARVSLTTTLKHNAPKCWVTRDSIILAKPNSGDPLTVEFSSGIPSGSDSSKPTIDGSVTFLATVTSKIIEGDEMEMKRGVGKPYNLEDQSLDTIRALVSSKHNFYAKFTKSDGSTVNKLPFQFWLYQSSTNHDIPGATIPLDSGFVQFKAQTSLGDNDDILLVELKISEVQRTIRWSNPIDTTKYSLEEVATTPTKNYVERNPVASYKIKDAYKKTTLVGTSITLNDLIYEPSVSGHRLFAKKSNYWLGCFGDNPGGLGGDIYYRSVDDTEISDETKNLNRLSFYTGPCFTLNSYE